MRRWRPWPIAAPRSTRIAARSELESNLLQRYTLEHGDCEAAFAGAAWVFAERFWTHRAPRIRWKGAACWRRRTRPAMR